MPRPELSLVIPIYNEEEVLPQLDVRLKELLLQLRIDTEVVFVNDGSKDNSLELLRRLATSEPRYKVLGFSRNFGHQRAITCGMDKSRGRAIVVMDADLQDPPEVILQMVAKWQNGYDVVYGRRRSRVGESFFKLLTAKIFYRLFAAMIPIEVPLDTGDFRLMSRRVVTTMRSLRETHRFVRGLVAWVGFRQTAVEYDRAARAAGETKYPFRKMLSFAIDGIASFSIQPLRLATYIGVLVGTGSVLTAIAAIISKVAGMTVPGWTTMVVLVAFLFSVQFFMIGVLGEYVGRIYEQVKRRPLYIISERINFGREKHERVSPRELQIATPMNPVLPAPMPTPMPKSMPPLPLDVAAKSSDPVGGFPPPPPTPTAPPVLPPVKATPPSEPDEHVTLPRGLPKEALPPTTESGATSTFKPFSSSAFKAANVAPKPPPVTSSATNAALAALATPAPLVTPGAPLVTPGAPPVRPPSPAGIKPTLTSTAKATPAAKGSGGVGAPKNPSTPPMKAATPSVPPAIPKPASPASPRNSTPPIAAAKATPSIPPVAPKNPSTPIKAATTPSTPPAIAKEKASVPPIARTPSTPPVAPTPTSKASVPPVALTPPKMNPAKGPTVKVGPSVIPAPPVAPSQETARDLFGDLSDDDSTKMEAATPKKATLLGFPVAKGEESD